ncbi:MAG: DUF2845 domain-containing protein [Proteobacteria bacterium]|nr:DUF2845 domain-containing protein [Pseudomonadota bacterium]
MRIQPLTLALTFALCSASALAADAAERRFIRDGMTEGEVVYRIGPPDHEAFIRIVKDQPEEKAWTYFPAPGDAQTLTTVTLRAGMVTKVERKISR